jgi:5-methylthioadenosine/S-adenosylhomocysteine deaminase
VRAQVCCRERRVRAAAAVPVFSAKENALSQRLLIRNGFVVSMDPDVGDIPHGDVFVEDGKIVDVGRDLGVTDAETVDASGMIVMPGFVDTHRHTWQTPVRGVLPSCTLDHYFAVMLGQVGGFYRPEDVYVGDWAGSLEALNAGVTTLLDWSHISNTPDHSDGAIQGLKDAGIRAVYAHGMPTGGEWWSFSELNHPEDIRRIRDTYFSSDDGLITLAMAARQPGNVNFDVAKHDWALARELGILISVHVGMRLHTLHYQPVKDMHDLGLMGPDVCYIHMTDLTDQELDWIAETGGKASVAPYVEMLMGHGPPPIGKMLARGVRTSLSVDVVSSVPGEMFTQMRTALAYDRILEFTDTPDVAFAPRLTHTDVLEFATIDGARSIGLEHKVGSLTRGKQADIVLLQTEAINTAPVLDPHGTIVTFADTSNVDSVFVAGRALKRDGKLVDVDVKAVIRKLEESRNHILSQGGLLPDWCAEHAGHAGHAEPAGAV